MHSLTFSLPAATRLVGVGLLLCALTLAPSGCVSSEGRTIAALPPHPLTPGAVVTDEYICLPHREAGELLLWMEHAEEVCR